MQSMENKQFMDDTITMMWLIAYFISDAYLKCCLVGIQYINFSVMNNAPCHSLYLVAVHPNIKLIPFNSWKKNVAMYLP